jgi:hypothetical protein
VAVTATKSTTELMAAQNDPDFRAEFWDRVFPGQLPAGDVEAGVVDESGFDLEGVGLFPIEAGHTDTDATTMLHVPQIGVLVVGDVVYSGVHLYLTESGRQLRHRLLAGRARRRRGAAPGHGDRWAQGCGAKDDPAQFQATRSYLTYARRLLATSESAEAFYRDMLALHPTRLNSGARWGGAHALFPSA